jgi:hypothetical protein
MILNLQFSFRDCSSILTSFSADFHSAIRVPQSAFVDADFSDRKTEMLPLELASKRDRDIERVFLNVGKTNRVSTMAH